VHVSGVSLSSLVFTLGGETVGSSTLKESSLGSLDVSRVSLPGLEDRSL